MSNTNIELGKLIIVCGQGIKSLPPNQFDGFTSFWLPEIALHPSKQRKFARDAARIKYGYHKDELLSPDDVKAYEIDMNQKITECVVDSELGIEIESFDKEIEEMNDIQEMIVFGEEKECVTIHVTKLLKK